uniref:Uncharacterized protein n=1 Tax=Panagrolaimus sp. PS1159 TaxID=55785 RepID=A0AC35GNW8_9BILA
MSFKILTPRPRTFIAPALPKIIEPSELAKYEDPDPEVRRFVEEQRRIQGLKYPLSPELENKQKLERLEKEVEELRQRNEELKTDLKKAKHIISSRKHVANRKLKRQAASSNEYKKKFAELSKKSQSRKIGEVWKSIVDDYGEESARKIISKIYDHHVEKEEKRKMTAAETLHMLKRSGISISALRIIRHLLIKAEVPNPFASDRAVNEERKIIGEFPNAEESMTPPSNYQLIKTEVASEDEYYEDEYGEYE